jgi:hypothetical protein
MMERNMAKGFIVGKTQVLTVFFKMIQLKDKEH